MQPWGCTLWTIGLWRPWRYWFHSRICEDEWSVKETCLSFSMISETYIDLMLSSMVWTWSSLWYTHWIITDHLEYMLTLDILLLLKGKGKIGANKNIWEQNKKVIMSPETEVYVVFMSSFFFNVNDCKKRGDQS